MTRHYEADILVPTLRGLDAHGCMDTDARHEYLKGVLTLTDEDKEILEGRNDSRFSQIVRNQVSHRNDVGNIVADGYASYDPSLGLCITDKGRKLISR